MSASKAVERPNAAYVVAIAMAVAGLSFAALSALSIVSAYFTVGSLVEELDATPETRSASIGLMWSAMGPSLILGLVVGGVGLLALRRGGRPANADRARQRLMGIALGVLLFVALGFMMLAVNYLLI